MVGKYAYVANNGTGIANNGGYVTVFDISNPAAPLQIATTSPLGNPWGIYVAGKYAYVTETCSSTAFYH